MKDDRLPPRPGESAAAQLPPADYIPLYVQGETMPLTEREALAVIAQLSSALQTHGAGMSRFTGEVVRNG